MRCSSKENNKKHCQRSVYMINKLGIIVNMDLSNEVSALLPRVSRRKTLLWQ